MKALETIKIFTTSALQCNFDVRFLLFIKIARIFLARTQLTQALTRLCSRFDRKIQTSNVCIYHLKQLPFQQQTPKAMQGTLAIDFILYLLETSRYNLLYHKSFSIIPSCSRQTLVAKYPKNELVREISG